MKINAVIEDKISHTEKKLSKITVSQMFLIFIVYLPWGSNNLS